jgi:hypothetical protein
LISPAGSFDPTPDAELYVALIAEFQPVRISEIDSGYSTLIARHTLRHLGIYARWRKGLTHPLQFAQTSETKRPLLYVDDELEFGRPLERKIGWLGTFEDAVDVPCRQAVHKCFKLSLIFKH